MWFTVGFSACCAACAYVLPAQLRMPCILAGAVAALLSGLLGRRVTSFRSAALVFLGGALGLIWYGCFYGQYLEKPAALDGETTTVTIHISDFSEETSYGIAADGTLVLDGKTYRVRVYLDQSEPLEPGWEATGPFRFAMTAPEEDPASYNGANGIFLLAYQADEMTLTQGNETWRDQIARFRQMIREILHDCFPADAVPFAQALLLGDTSEIDYETDTDFKVSGIRHVVAVSGLHVSILFALLGAVTFKKRYLMAPVGLGVLFLFAALAGFSPSVNRACIMSALMLLALLLNREYDGPTALSFAVLVMLVCNPLTVANVSFQLSVASVAGIYLFQAGIAGWMTGVLGGTDGGKLRRTVVRWVTTSVSITLSAMVFTTPLCAYYFGMVSLIGPLTNLLALWVISLIFYGIMAVCLLYGLTAAGAALLAKLVSLPIRYVLLVAKTLADFPLAAVYTESDYITIWLVFVYILLVVFLFGKNRRPAVLSCCAALGLCIALLASWNEGRGEFRMTVLDVGQGQCILIQSEGRNYMVDCGGDSDTKTADLAAAALLSRGITKLDGLILTHLDRDHAGGAEYLLSRVDTALLILPGTYTELGQATAGEVLYAEENLRITAGNTVITVYAPTFPGTSNEMSLCVLFDTEKCDILITGDRDGFGERMLLRNAEIPDVDILVAGHHGSKNSTCEELLSAVRPEIVCISVGAGNSYGHPASELLKRLDKFVCTVYRTDIHGTISIRR